MRFDNLTPETKIEKGVVYFWPKESFKAKKDQREMRPTHIGLRKGHLTLFWSDQKMGEYHSIAHRFFKKIPKGINGVCFPDFQDTNSAIDYGQIRWADCEYEDCLKDRKKCVIIFYNNHNTGRIRPQMVAEMKGKKARIKKQRRDDSRVSRGI